MFNYFHQVYPNGRVLLVGMNYWFINEICTSLSIPIVEVVSKEKSRINPSIKEIIDIIYEQHFDMVFLASPANPSGEVYDEEEIARLIKVVKEKGIIFCLDKCQSDEFNVYEKYINLVE